jgi:hypothetical protein
MATTATARTIVVPLTGPAAGEEADDSDEVEPTETDWVGTEVDEDDVAEMLDETVSVVEAVVDWDWTVLVVEVVELVAMVEVEELVDVWVVRVEEIEVWVDDDEEVRVVEEEEVALVLLAEVVEEVVDTVDEVEVVVGVDELVVVSAVPLRGTTVRSPEPFPGSSTTYTFPVNWS